MPYHAVNKIASRVWKQCGLEHVTATANGFMLFRFNTEENMHAVLEKGPWMFGGKNIILQQWHPRFQFDKNKISTLPVWIRLHGLPFPLWSKQGLSLAASMIGRPLSCDEQTYNCTRLEYARLCVEIDANLPYVQDFEIESPLSAEPITVTVDYEWKPSRCDKCNVFGHSCLPQPATMDKGKGIADHQTLPHTTPQPPTNRPMPIPPDHSPTSNDPTSSTTSPPTIQCPQIQLTITTEPHPVALTTSNPNSPTALCSNPPLAFQQTLHTTSPPADNQPDQLDLPVPNGNNPESGNEPVNTHSSLLPIAMDIALC